MGDNRPPVYYELDEDENPNLIIRTSAIGSTCLFELVAAGQGYEMLPVPDNLQRAFDEGHLLEPLIVGMLEGQGHFISNRQDQEELVVESGLLVRFHPDGLIRDTITSDPGVLEIKALSDALWQKAARGSVGDVFEEYKWQLSVMMHHYGLPGRWVALNKGNADGSPCPDKGKLLVENVPRPPIDLQTIFAKARTIKELVEGEDIVVANRPCDDPTHYPCRFIYLRPEPEGVEVGVDEPRSKSILEVPDEDKSEVDRLVREYLMFKGEADEAKQRMDVAKEALISYAGEDHGKLRTDKFIVPIVDGSNSSPDWANMPQSLKDEVNKYKKRTTYRYLRGIKPLD